MAGQDIKKRLLPGQAQPVNVGGDFIFLKFADRPVEIIINGGESAGSRVTMEAGDKYRPGGFDSFEVQNSDTTRPAQIVMTVGRGDYNRQIVKGEIAVDPILRNADGTTKTDTRFQIKMELYPRKVSVTSYSQYQIIDTLNIAPLVEQDGDFFQGVYRGHAFRVGDDLAVAVTNNFRNDGEVLIFDKDQNLKTTVDIQLDANDKVDSGWHPGYGYLTVETAEKTKIKTVNTGSYSTGATIFTDENEIDSFCWVPGKNTFLVYNAIDTARKITEYDESFGKIRSWTIPESGGSSRDRSHIRYDPDLNKIWVKVGETVKLIGFDYDTGERIEDYDSPEIPEAYSFQPFRNVFYSLDGNKTLYKCALVDFDTKPIFTAVKSGCGVTTALYKSNAEPQIFALFEVSELQTGVTLKGEVIRAALEWYFQRKAPDNYLDHVYQLDATRDDSGRNFKTVKTGNETFSRAKVKDDFAVMLPGEIVVTIDNEMTFEGDV